MKIIAQLFNDYNSILQKMEGAEIDFGKIVNEAIQNTLKKADWTQLKPFKYKKTATDDGYFWKPIFLELNYDLYKEVQRYMKNGITIDDVVNFSLLFSKKFMLAKMKKEILDTKWTAKRIATVMEKMAGVECVRINSDSIKFEICPLCDHEDFMIFLNEDDLPRSNCFKCGTSDIWEILCEVSVDNFVDVIHEAWEVLEEKAGEESKEEEIKITKHKHKQKINMQEIEKILEEAKTNNNMYMQKQGFTKAELQEFEIFYRSGQTVGGKEADDFRYRVVYVIRDKDGNIAGLQGRSIWDDEEERKRKVMQDEHWKKLYWDSSAPEKVKDGKLKKLCAKVISTQGFQKSEHLYLLHKYAKNPSTYRKLVIVEGPKDAARVYCRRLPGVAVVSPFGCTLSSRQIELIGEVFAKDIEILLAYDADEAGVAANIKAWKQLRDAGFTKVHFVVYTEKNKKGEMWKDFGEMVAPRSNKGYYDKLTRQIETMLNRVVASLDLYLREMEKAGIKIEDEKTLQIIDEARKERHKQAMEEANAVYMQAIQKETKTENNVKTVQPQQQQDEMTPEELFRMLMEDFVITEKEAWQLVRNAFALRQRKAAV